MTSAPDAPARARRTPTGARTHRDRRVGPALACLSCGLLLGGCAAIYDQLADEFGGGTGRIRMPSTAQLSRAQLALLRPPHKPSCGTDAADGGPAATAAPRAADADLALRITLEYERECYRRAEMRIRAQLQALQAAVTYGGKAHGGSAFAVP